MTNEHHSRAGRKRGSSYILETLETFPYYIYDGELLRAHFLRLPDELVLSIGLVKHCKIADIVATAETYEQVHRSLLELADFEVVKDDRR